MTGTLVATGLNGLWQGVLLTLLAWVLIRLQKNLNATSRHAAWLVVLLMVAAVPFFSPVPGFPALPGDSGHVQAPSSTGARNDTAPVHPSDPAPPPDTDGGFLTHVSVSRKGGTALVALWISGVSFLLLRFGLQLMAMRRIRARSTEPPAEFRRVLEGCLEEAGVHRPVALRLSDAVDVPATIGAVRPAILLPMEMSMRLSHDHLRRVLSHELAHVARHDFWTLLVQRLVGTVWFFHPAVIWINRRIALERELACDERVIDATGCPTRDYISSLLGVGELALAAGLRRRQHLMLPMASQLRRRVLSLQKESSFSPGLSFRRLTTLASVLGVVALLVGGTLSIGVASPISPVPVEADSGETPLTRAIMGLRSPDPASRARAAYSLSMMRGEAASAIPALLELIPDETPVPRVPRETSPVWGRPGEDRDHTSPGEEALKALVYIGHPSIEPLRDAIVRQGLPPDHDAVWALNLLRDFD